MMAGFQSKDASVPFPRNAQEWQAKIDPATGTNFTPERAEHKMRQDVFGHDYQSDGNGRPVERGKGSIAQPTSQHQEALMISQEAALARKMRLGWHPGMEQAFDPKVQDRIDREVEARVKAALAGKKPGRKTAKRKKTEAKPIAAAEV